MSRPPVETPITDGHYTLYVMDVSYFSGKMEAYLRYKGVPFVRREPSWRTIAGPLYEATGWMKVPVVHTPEGQWLQDSTPMIRWFEERVPSAPVLPASPALAFLTSLLEDYADEWLWRPALHYRWAFEPDASMNLTRFWNEFLYDAPAPRPLTEKMTLLRQKRAYLAGDGVRPATRAHVEGIYTKTLARLEAIFRVRPFLLGDAPSLADFGFFASMFRHFSIDPTPARIMRLEAPAVYEWVARMWNARGDDLYPRGAAPFLSALPEDWAPILRDLGEAYLPYLQANAAAFSEGKKRFDLEIQGAPYRRMAVSAYRVYCLEALRDALAAMSASERMDLDPILREHGLLGPLTEGPTVRAHLHPHGPPPVCARRAPTRLDRVRRLFFGNDWDVPNPPLA